MNEAEHFSARTRLVQHLVRKQGWDGILINRADNFAMATGGRRNYVSTHCDVGACGIFVPREGAPHYAGNAIEATRIMDEELASPACYAAPFRWFDESAADWCRTRFSGNLVSDDGSLGTNVNAELTPLRTLLLPVECEAYRELGRLAAEAMEATLAAIEPGISENDISARLIFEGQRRGCQVPVSLVAADERIARYRHPLPTLPGTPHARRVDRYVMVVAGVIRRGLSVSLTRFKKVASIPPELEERYRRICAVDVLMQEATRPGRTLGEVFADCQDAYARLGFADDEWHNHHQGGTTGFAGRTCKATPGEPFPCLNPAWADDFRAGVGLDVPVAVAFAWNPSAPGVKSEDTFLLHEDGRQELLSTTPSLPVVDLESALGRPVSITKSAMAEPSP